MFNYHRSKLVFGLTLFEYHDSIKEGDGERLLDLYRLLLLLFKANHKTKYAYACLLYLVQLEAILSESDAHNLKWNRFFSKYGGKGANIPLDLRMEQYNKIVKTMWRSLGANLTEESASRLANTVEPVEIILDRVDEDCGLKATKGYRSKGKPEEAVAQITKDLMQIKAFQTILEEKVILHFPNSHQAFSMVSITGTSVNGWWICLKLGNPSTLQM